jgi:primase-polymerase (primpol)-like protein
LINRDRWIRYSKNKVPLQVNGSTASSIDLDTWSDFITANASDAGVGLGFVFNDDGIVGIDLDNALYKNGQIKSWAKQIVDKFSGTYMEISPSKLGLHIYLIGEIDKASRQKIEDGGLEIYSTSRYFTVTGNNYKSSPLTLIDFGKIEVSDVRSSA